eukprot:sb/3474566/
MSLLLLFFVVLLSSCSSSSKTDGLLDCSACGNGTRDCIEDICTCKTNVIGSDCTKCRHGTVGLEVENPAGCSPCYCSDHSPSCSLQSWSISYAGESFEASRGAGWYVEAIGNNRTSENIHTSFGGSSEYISYTRNR